MARKKKEAETDKPFAERSSGWIRKNCRQTMYDKDYTPIVRAALLKLQKGLPPGQANRVTVGKGKSAKVIMLTKSQIQMRDSIFRRLEKCTTDLAKLQSKIKVYEQV